MRPFMTPAAWLTPIRASHLIQLDFYTDTRNFIHIWLPEGYGSGENQCSVLDRVEDRRFSMEGEVLVMTFEREDYLRVRGEVVPIDDGLNMHLSITNLSKKRIPASEANVCVQFAAAPSFTDTTLERYFYVSNDVIVNIKPPYQNFESNHAWFFGTSPDERFLHNPPPDFGFIGLKSKDGNWVAGLGWDSSGRIMGNCHPSLSCIHADPQFDAIAPLETAQSDGVLYLMKGGPEECVARLKSQFLRKPQ